MTVGTALRREGRQEGLEEAASGMLRRGMQEKLSPDWLAMPTTKPHGAIVNPLGKIWNGP